MKDVVFNVGGGTYYPPQVEMIQLRPRPILGGSQGETDNYTEVNVWDENDID